MKSITDIDANFKVGSKIKSDNMKFYSSQELPLKIYGLIFECGKFRRIPESVAKSVSEGVLNLHTNTAGGRVKFRTNSANIAISVLFDGLGKMPHFALTGSVGFDLYEDNNYKGTFIPPYDIENGYESVIDLGNSRMKNITINFPLYSDVKELHIGIDKSAEIAEPLPYKALTPIVYYGSSITQGGCASRPGMTYQSIISRRLNLDHINLGFSGSAKAEKEIAEYIKGLAMSVFVYDYDYNSPSVEYLAETHYKMFEIIRNANPTLPIIIMSRPKCALNDNEKKRKKIIKSTYKKALVAGDKNVYFIGGDVLMEFCGDEGTVDGVHCTDLGFYSMAEVVGNLIEKILAAK